MKYCATLKYWVELNYGINPILYDEFILQPKVRQISELHFNLLIIVHKKLISQILE